MFTYIGRHTQNGSFHPSLLPPFSSLSPCFMQCWCSIWSNLCYLPGFNVIHRTRGNHEFEKNKNGFLGQGCDTRITDIINIQHNIYWRTCMSGKLLANALVGHALAVNWFTEILYELFTLTSTKSKKKIYKVKYLS